MIKQSTFYKKITLTFTSFMLMFFGFNLHAQCDFGQYELNIDVGGGTYDSEISWAINNFSEELAGEFTFCATPNTNYFTYFYDTFGDGWNGAYMVVSVPSTGEILFNQTLSDGNYGTYSWSVEVGCTDATANNYNPNAVFDNGTCYYPTCVDLTVSFGGGLYDEEISIGSFAGDTPAGTFTQCYEPGEYQVTLWDSFGDGWNGAYITISTASGTVLLYETLLSGSTITHYFTLEACDEGYIMDCNGNCAPEEWIGDGVCDNGDYESFGFPIYFNCSQFADDGGDCSPVNYGCMEEDATNYSPDATVDDGSCIFENTVEGCTNPDACNYNPDATVEDGSCEQLTIFVTTYDYDHQMITVNTNAPFCTYEWSLNGATFSETSNELIPAQNGVYQLVVTDALNDCSATQLISVTTVGLDESNIDNNINIFPNPATDYIEINTLDQIKSIDVINVIGEIVIHKEVNGETNQRLSVTDLPKGYYIIRLISGTQSYSSTFLKE